jgi:hypothetical protein
MPMSEDQSPVLCFASLPKRENRSRRDAGELGLGTASTSGGNRMTVVESHGLGLWWWWWWWWWCGAAERVRLRGPVSAALLKKAHAQDVDSDVSMATLQQDVSGPL